MRNINTKIFLYALRKKAVMISAFVFLLSGTACKKYLDAKPNDSLATPSTLADLQAILDYSTYMNSKSLSYGEASADDYFLTQATYNQLAIKGQLAYTWSPYPNPYVNDYANAYFIVYNSNVCLDALEKIDRTELNKVAWDNVKGSALFFRAYTFLKLAWTYAKAYDSSTSPQDLGIILRLGSDFNVPSTRSTVEQSYQQIISDLDQALPLLPNDPIHVLRPSKAAVYAQLARTYLSMRIYDKALLNADLSLKIKSNLVDYNSINATATAPFQSFNPEVIFHEDISTYSYLGISPNNGCVDSTLYQSYDNDDLRKSILFSVAGNYRQFKGTYASRTIGVRPLFTGIATDEVLLIRAECLARAGDKDAALKDLNTLMMKRWKNTATFPTFTAPDAQAALALILKERRKELLFRGLRWIDIKRLNLEGNNISLKRDITGTAYLLPANSNKFALPLPEDVIALSGVLQNPD